MVLNNLLAISALPEGLLRAVGPKIAGLLVPSAGIERVLKSANIDVDMFKARLEAAGVFIPSEGVFEGASRTNLYPRS